MAGLATAFVALAGSGELVFGLCAEMDALPGIGHAADSRELADLLPMLADRRLNPVIDSAFPLDDAVAAQERLVSDKRFGKVVLTIDG